jgi:hypothetical protein
MASSTSTPTPPDALNEDGENVADLPMTMAASVILEHLPKDAHAALETAGELRDANGELKDKGETERYSPTRLEVVDAKTMHSQGPPFASTEHEISQATCVQLRDDAAVRVCCAVLAETSAAQGS